MQAVSPGRDSGVTGGPQSHRVHGDNTETKSFVLVSTPPRAQEIIDGLCAFPLVSVVVARRRGRVNVVGPYFNACSIAARSSGASGFTLLG